MTALRMAMAFQCAMVFALERANSDDDEDSAWLRRFARCQAQRDLLLALEPSFEATPRG